MIYTLGWNHVAGAVLTVGLIVAGFVLLRNYLRELAARRKEAARSARMQSRSGAALRDTLRGEVKPVVAIETLAPIDDDGADFFAKRDKRSDARHQLEMQVRMDCDAHEQQKEVELGEWYSQQEVRARKLAELTPAVGESLQVSINLAADPAVQAWAESSNTALINAPLELDGSRHAAAYEEIRGVIEKIVHESNELDYVVDKLETSVDFISMEFNDAIEKWKTGEAFRTATLEDLKRRFRLKTFSLDDAWGLVFSYPDWISRQRRRLKMLIEKAGAAKVLKDETLAAMLQRAEQGEWAKNLEIDMDLIFILREIAKAGKLLEAMTDRLTHLEAACSRRSGQVISPSWEARSARN